MFLKLILKNFSIQPLIIFIFVFYMGSVFLGGLESHGQDLVKLGKETFKSKGCIACHTIGQGDLSGPDLIGVTKRREEKWLKQWLKSPDTMVFTDPIAKELLKKHFVPMPNQNLSDEQIIYLIEYLKYEDSKK